MDYYNDTTATVYFVGVRERHYMQHLVTYYILRDFLSWFQQHVPGEQGRHYWLTFLFISELTVLS